jgi:DinB family protein
MDFRLDTATEILERTPAHVDALLRGLSSEWLESNEGGETWNARQVIGHLIHGEDTDWIPRARIILEHGESRPFDTFDRSAQFERFAGVSLDELLRTFARRRAENLGVLRDLRLTPVKLALTGTHPQLGRVTLAQLLATWTVHDLDHVSQLARILAYQYKQAVGPWTAKGFLRVLGG